MCFIFLPFILKWYAKMHDGQRSNPQTILMTAGELCHLLLWRQAEKCRFVQGRLHLKLKDLLIAKLGSACSGCYNPDTLCWLDHTERKSSIIGFWQYIRSIGLIKYLDWQGAVLHLDQVFFQDFEFYFRYFLKTLQPARFHPPIAVKKSFSFFCPFHGGLVRAGSQ